MHSRRMCLQHSRIAIYVDHKSGQEVAFAMHEPVGVVVRPDDSECTSHGHCLAQSRHIEFFVDHRICEVKHAHCDTSDLIVSCAYEVAFEVGHCHFAAFLDIVWQVIYCP